VSDTIPSGDQLRFDWAWIAAARQVIELNLRDLLKDRHHGVLRALLSLQGLRSCSAPGSPSEAESDSEADVFEDGEGWDWAGVEGQWRCVYILGHNAFGTFFFLFTPVPWEPFATGFCAEADTMLTDDVCVGWTIVT
jgi:hypothetical protein